MSEMSHPVADTSDEFGGLAHLIPPGQDPELLPRLHALYTAEIKPSNFIERMWVRDMAIDAARAEYLRLANCAVHRVIEEKQAAEDAARGDDAEQATERSQRKVGKAFLDRLPLLDGMIKLEHEVVRERDRIFHQYDTRAGVVKAYRDALALIAELDPERDND